jgi:hypothetical protein
MLKRIFHAQMLVAVFVVTTFVSAPLSMVGQKASPVAPARAQVEAVVREAYEKFKTDNSGKNADYARRAADRECVDFQLDVLWTGTQGRRETSQLRQWQAIQVKTFPHAKDARVTIGLKAESGGLQ